MILKEIEMKVTVYQMNNEKAESLKEHKNFVAIKGERKDMCTDIVFDEKGKIKNIFSELSREEVKKILSDMVDEHYEKY
jgi:hypothetical protein